MLTKLLTPGEVDEWLAMPQGRASRMARNGLLPHLVLPNGDLRFEREAIEQLLRASCAGSLAPSFIGFPEVMA